MRLFLLTGCLLGFWAIPSFGANLDAPTHLEASNNVYPDRVGLSWDHIRGAKLYRIFRSDVADASAATSVGTTESIVFSDPSQPSKAAFYWLRAEDGDSISAMAGPVRGSTTKGSARPFSREALAMRVPIENPVTGAKVFLGRTLFGDEQLSSTRTTACGTCHRGRAGGSDPRSVFGLKSTTHPGPDGTYGTGDDRTGSRGVPASASDGTYRSSTLFGLREQVTPRKALSVFTSALSIDGVLWDGRAGPAFLDPVDGTLLLPGNASLESQALLPLLNTVEMAHQGRTLDDVVQRVKESRPLALSPSVPAPLARWIGGRSYSDLFDEAFGTPAITPARIAMAIASYERTLPPNQTPLEGSSDIVAQRFGFGILAFDECIACHRPGSQGSGFINTGVRPVAEDVGRGAFSGNFLDQGAFRNVSLVNAALRGPLFHNGGAATLEDSIEFYSHGGDFPSASTRAIIPALRLDDRQKTELTSFIRLAFTDARAAGEYGPLFSRPMLYSESARVPRIEGVGRAAADGAVPEMIALEPPLAGAVGFTIAVNNASGGRAVLMIDRSDPGTGPTVPEGSGVIRREADLTMSSDGKPFGSTRVTLPEEMAGVALWARWYIDSGDSVAVSPAARFTLLTLQAPIEQGLRTVSAASLLQGMVPPGSIVSGFGTNLGSTLGSNAETASPGEAPENLGGTQVVITDAEGKRLNAPLLYVSPSQINYLIPASAALGEARVAVLRDNGNRVTEGTVQIGPGPGLFTANATGRDTAAAYVQRGDAIEPASLFDKTWNEYVSAPLAPSSSSGITALVLFGTGIPVGAEVTATIGGVKVPVLYAGPQDHSPGLDQVNLQIPADFNRHGEVDVVLTVNGQRANLVRVRFE